MDREAKVSYSPWGCQESDTTKQLNNNSKGVLGMEEKDEVRRT